MVWLIILFSLIALVDLAPLIRKKEWRDVTALSILLGLALVISVTNQLGTPIPSSFMAMDKLMRNIGLYYR